MKRPTRWVEGIPEVQSAGAGVELGNVLTGVRFGILPAVTWQFSVVCACPGMTGSED